MSKQVHSYNDDTKIVRIPIDVKEAIDSAKPPGIELWKFTADVIWLGLDAFKHAKGNKETSDISSYDVAPKLIAAARRAKGGR